MSSRCSNGSGKNLDLYFNFHEMQLMRKGILPKGRDSSPIYLGRSDDHKELYNLQYSRIDSESCKIGDVWIKSSSPTTRFYAVFEEEDGVAYFHAAEDKGGSSYLDQMQIYNLESVQDNGAEHLFEILWSNDGLKSALLINGFCHAVYDFQSFHGYCRTGFPESTDKGKFHKFSHRWDDSCLKLFQE